MPPEGEQHAAGHRTQQAGEGVDLVDDGIPGDELFFLHQQGDAGLDGRLVGAGNAVKEHQHSDKKGGRWAACPRAA